MSWIHIISYNEASGKLKRLYDKITGPGKNIDNIMLVHGLRPHTMTGHMSLYKNVLHHNNNTLPKWFLETIGIFVSMLNDCSYCIDHHFEGLKRILKDDESAGKIRRALEQRSFADAFDAKFSEALVYSEKLTIHPSQLKHNDIEDLRVCDLSDGEILEINQVVSYFNYANRTVLGLGVTTKGDILGLSPNNSQDENNWNHQ